MTLQVASTARNPKPAQRALLHTAIVELGPKRPSPLWFWGPNSIIVVYMDPLGIESLRPKPETLKP